jgi:thiamine pyrophosphokinase
LTRQALIFANGDANEGAMVARTLDTARGALVIAADGGARIARHFGQTIHFIVGDMDSVEPSLLSDLQTAGTRVERYPVHKNETDLELALALAVREGARWIRIIGGVGDRLDQTLSNVYLLALPVLDGCDARLVAGRQETWLISAGEWTIEGDPDDTISLIPLSGAVRGVRTEGLYYPLRDEDLLFGPARGVSNVMQEKSVQVCVREGVLLVVHTIGRA